MSSPNAVSARNNPVVAQIVLGRMQKKEDFIADKIFLPVKVDKLTGDVKTFGGNQHRIYADLQGSGPSKQLFISITKASAWNIERHGLKAYLSYKDKDAYENENDARADWSDATQEALMIAREYAAASYLTNVSNITQNDTLTSGEYWNTKTTSDPLGDLRTARKEVRSGDGSTTKGCGKYPNVAIMGPNVLEALIDHADLKVAANNVGEEMVSLDRLKKILFPTYPPDKCKILIGMAQYNSSQLGQTATYADIWGNHFMYLYINPNPTPRQHEKSFGYKFHNGKGELVVKNWIDPDTDPDEWVKNEWYFDDVVLSTDCAYLIYNAYYV